MSAPREDALSEPSGYRKAQGYLPGIFDEGPAEPPLDVSIRPVWMIFESPDAG